MSRTVHAPVEGTVRFVQHNLPGLDAGEYMLEVKQTVSTQKEAIANRYFFTVVGDRFAINAEDIAGMYPPDRSIGEYENTLPHIMLKKQTLPWQRYPTVDEPERKYPDGKHDRDVPTWLVVLLFDEDDIAAYPGFDPQAKTLALSDLFFERPATTGAQGYSYFYRESKLGPKSDPSELAKHLDHGQTPADRCQVIDVPMKLFFAIAPSVDDLKMLAHIRNVDITKKATQNGVPASRNDLSKIPGTSDYAVVLGNRMPKKGKRTFAHLVSLEGLAPFLPLDTATGDASSDVTAPTTVAADPEFKIATDGYMRLASLASWSFSSTGDGRAFERLLSELAPKNSTGAAGDFSMGLPFATASSTDSAAVRQAKNALAMGYTALEHHTRDGGRTVSWYRGPLLPRPVATARGLPTYTSADAATSFDPNTGMLDVSYAIAWQLGRLLALQNKQFSMALYKWRQDNLRDAVSTMETLLAHQSLDSLQQQLRDRSLVYPLLKTFLPDAPRVALPARLASAVGAAPRRKSVQAVLADPIGLSEVIQEKLEAPLEIYTWLAKLKLLEGVPFRYLVPDERMLPPESIRMFYLDMNWVHALLDGALSIGRNAGKQVTSAENAHDVTVKPTLLRAVDRRARAQRAFALKVAAPPGAQPVEMISGFLLRSAVVEGWPGLEVNGYADDEAGTLMDIVRFERLAPTVMLCLFEKDNKVVRQVDIHEPAEGLHFGATNDSPAKINVRYNVQHGNDGPGRQASGVLQLVPFRGTNENRVVRMFRLAKALDDPKYAPYIQNIVKDFDHLPSSELAMQLIKGVGLVSFNLQPKAGA